MFILAGVPSHLAAVLSGELGTSINGSVFVPGACGPRPSALGYQCSWAGPNGIVLHWSFNVTHPPANRCTRNGAVPSRDALASWNGDIAVHFALQAASPVCACLGWHQEMH
jgi:hypothetical protein